MIDASGPGKNPVSGTNTHRVTTNKGWTKTTAGGTGRGGGVGKWILLSGQLYRVISGLSGGQTETDRQRQRDRQRQIHTETQRQSTVPRAQVNRDGQTPAENQF